MVDNSRGILVDNHVMCEIGHLAKTGMPIAVDFDSTLALTDGYPHIVGVNGKCFEVLHKWQDAGCKILLNTMRRGKDLESAVVWCANCGFFFDGVNKNPDDNTEGHTKIYATFYVDDKALGTPLIHDKSGKLKSHVDWNYIDTVYTTQIIEITNKIKQCYDTKEI